MAKCPFALQKLIPAGSNDPRIEAIGVVYHVAVSLDDSLHDYFNGPSGGIESHFYIRHDGTVEQYRDTAHEADANYRGNSFMRNGKLCGFISIETEGMGEGEWTPEQLASLKKLTLWLADTHGFPVQKCPGPFSPGVGYHTMWGAPSDWTPVAKSCPGPQRVTQFHTVFEPWFANPLEVEDVELSDKIAKWTPGEKNGDESTTVGRTLNQARGYAEGAYAIAKRTEAALTALAAALGPEVKAAVEDALKSAVIDVDVTVNGGDK